MPKFATRGRQDVGNVLSGIQVAQNRKQIKNQQQQIALQQAQISQAAAAEQAAHERWYFGLPAHKQAEYDLGLARQELAQAQGLLPGLEAPAATLGTPRSKSFNLTWLSVLAGLGLVLFLIGCIGGSGGSIFWGLTGIVAGGWVYLIAPMRRRSKGVKAHAAAAEVRAQIEHTMTVIAGLEIRAVDPGLPTGV